MSLLTVGIPAYKSGKYIKKAINSVLNQTLEDLELFVFDDCPEDNEVEEIIQEYINIPNFHFEKLKKNVGAAKNWDNCLHAGSGEYVAMLHADDFWHYRHAEKMIGMLEEHKNCVLSYNPCIWVNENNKILQVMNHVGHRKLPYFGGRNEMSELLIYDDYITISSVIFRRDIVNQTGFFTKVLCTDWEYIIRVAQINSNFCFDPEPTTFYRWHENQQSNEFYKSNDPLIATVSLIQDTLNYFGGKEKLHGYETKVWSFLVGKAQQYPEGAFGMNFMISKIAEILKGMDGGK